MDLSLVQPTGIYFIIERINLMLFSFENHVIQNYFIIFDD